MTEQEYITVVFDRPRKYKWSTGKYMGKTYKEALETCQDINLEGKRFLKFVLQNSLNIQAGHLPFNEEL